MAKLAITYDVLWSMKVCFYKSDTVFTDTEMCEKKYNFFSV